jgi:hypothetical protein
VFHVARWVVPDLRIRRTRTIISPALTVADVVRVSAAAVGVPARAVMSNSRRDFWYTAALLVSP